MWKTYRPGAAGSLISNRRARLLCTLAAVMGIAAYRATTRAFGQDQPPASKTAPMSGEGADGNPSTPDDGTSGSSRAGGSESLLGGIRNAPGSVIVVTLVIAAMSFYLIALVVWMALNYRTSRPRRPSYCAHSDLLDQTKFNEAYHRLVSDLRSWRGCLPPAFASFPLVSLRPSSRWSSPTRARQWRWSIAPPIWPPSERSGR